MIDAETSPVPTTLACMRMKEVTELLRTSRATVYRWLRQGKFVQPIHLSPRITVYNRAEVHAWLQQQRGAR